jgi:hypothetical protein
MVALAKVLFKAPSDTTSYDAQVSDIEILKMISIFCAVGLAVSLIVASYGLDLSPGFF